MADIRINALATTAASTASDDFIAVDGSANGTRKLNAYSPTFGGNLTVSGGTTVIGASSGSVNGVAQLNRSTTSQTSQLQFQTAGSNDWQIYTTGASTGLYFYGGGDNRLVLSPTGNATLAGNLTVNGTSSVFSNTLALKAPANTAQLDFQNSSGTVIQSIKYNDPDGSLTIGGSASVNVPIYFNSKSGVETARITTGGNLLVGTTTDSANGKLQLATHTTSAGGIGFGTDTSLFRKGVDVIQFTTSYSGSSATVGKLWLDNSYFSSATPSVNAIKLNVYGGSSAGEGYGIGVDSTASLLLIAGNSGATAGIKFATGTGGTTALTLDSSQRCILSGALRLNNAYVSGAPTATGYVTLQDSAGNTYKVLVGT